MRTIHILILSLDVIFNSIEISSGLPPKERDFLANFGKTSEPPNFQDLSSQLNPLHNEDPNHGLASPGPPNLPKLDSPKRNLPLPICDTSPSAEQPLRARSRSPTHQQTFTKILGYDMSELRFIRLISKKYPNQVFELRKYTFPPDKPEIQMRARNIVHEPLPTGEQIVLSKSNGDVYAILKKQNKHTTLRGIYKPYKMKLQRAKINMNTGTVYALTPEERAETPLSTQDSITKVFRVERVNNNSPQN